MKYFIILNSKKYICEKVQSNVKPQLGEDADTHSILEVTHDEFEHVRIGWEKRDYGWDNSYLSNEVNVGGMTPEEISDYNVNPENLRYDELQAFLDDSDYKIIKSMECQLAGVECDIDVTTLHQKRQSWRDELGRIKDSRK